MVRPSSSPSCLSFGPAVGVRCPLRVGAGFRVWGPGTGPMACVSCGVSRAAVKAGGCPRGEYLALLPGVCCVRRSFIPSCPFLGAGSRVLLPMFSGRGWCGCGDPAPAPQCALLRACVACCRVVGGRSRWGCLVPLWGASGVRRPPPPLPHVLGVGSRGPLPTYCCARGFAGLGSSSMPHQLA